jgi:hypothetical protein
MSRIFDHYNAATPCPICGGTEDGKAVLIPITGTGDGRCVEAAQVHLNCLLHSLRYQRMTSCGDVICCNAVHRALPTCLTCGLPYAQCVCNQIKQETGE